MNKSISLLLSYARGYEPINFSNLDFTYHWRASSLAVFCGLGVWAEWAFNDVTGGVDSAGTTGKDLA